jgi:tetratricopeptide (TPR) repeat protein
MIANTNLRRAVARRPFTGVGMIACLCLMVVATASQAQRNNRDYYRANETHDDAQTLRNAELYHIGPGIDRMKGKNYPGALQDFQFILDVFPNHPQALALLSDLCDLQWRAPQCDIDSRFEAAIARNENAAPTYLIYGMHLQRRNQLPQAVESYKKSISINPNSANAHYNLALAYFDQKQLEQSNREAQIAYALGIPLPGLKDKLTRAKAWKPIEGEELKKLMASAVPAPPAPAAAATAPASTTPAAASPPSTSATPAAPAAPTNATPTPASQPAAK